ncbi:hypothetical protein [Clostridium cylindrosporum]|uniref:Uncharacterized protein n=1 Tax=Clostridium cylindrosporum DSM 605 TaxID=1121307 RepID=A0A0J8DFG7_CLOCY|nr:hypothetical protein [Clostridium cylindrosporum]KMT22994.1 hypothetical protein CLCY_7c00410 [Clostridium cylindrosporum DSM 605]
MRLNKVTIEPVTSAIEDLVIVKNLLENISKAETSTGNEHICKRYVDVQNVASVAKELNDEGFRTNGRKYIGKDVSKVISITPGTIGAVAKAFHKFNNTLQNGSKSFTSLLKELKAIGEIK